MKNIILSLKKDEITTKKGDKASCVEVNIYLDSKPNEVISYRDFKLAIPYDVEEVIDVDTIIKDDFNRYILGGYCVPNAYSYGLKLLIARAYE